jgi:hypothetical protein
MTEAALVLERDLRKGPLARLLGGTMWGRRWLRQSAQVETGPEKVMKAMAQPART